MDSAVIVLIPDSDYIRARPKGKDHHLTVAYYGVASTAGERVESRLRMTVASVAYNFTPIKAKANGIGLFNNPGDGIAVVDLIDGIGPLNVRAYVTQFDGLDGATIDTRHGFTPHITREFLEPEDDVYATIHPDMIDSIEFKFVAVGLWFGDQRLEISL